jgi:uncharacterized protein
VSETKPDPGSETNRNPHEPGPENETALFTFLQSAHTIFMGPEGLRPGWRIFLYLGSGVVLFLILSSFASLIPSRGAGYLWQDMFVEAALAVSSILPAIAMAMIEDRPFCVYGLPLRQVRGRLFCAGLLWGIMTLSLLMFVMHLFGVFSYGKLALHGARMVKFALFWGAFFLLVGVFEEFSYRGYTQFTLSQAIGFWPAAYLLSFIFGGLHLLGNVGENWLGSTGVAMIGLFFCFTLRRTGNLWFAVGMHASWDWGESYLYSVPDSGETMPGHLLNSSFHGSRWLTGGSVGPEGSVLVFVVIAAAWVVFDRLYPAVKLQHVQIDAAPATRVGADL